IACISPAPQPTDVDTLSLHDALPIYRDEQLDDATAYGYAAASTIGHEITHGFDDEGRQFDEKGNLKSWWTKKDEAEFNKRAQVRSEEHTSELQSLRQLVCRPPIETTS